MKITNVRYVLLRGSLDYQGPLGEERLVRPLDIYPDQYPLPTGWPVGGSGNPPYPVEQAFVYVDTDEGISGIWGPIMQNLVPIIDSLKSVIIGENPLAVERIWDRLYRLAIHGRKGRTMMAISTLDLAIWDLKGKILGAPVYELLGGPTREGNRAYASMLGFSVEPEKAAERAREVVEQGYTATKWFFRHGPAQGPEGMKKNVALIRAVREAVGPDVDIMFDAWSSWDLRYTCAMADLAAEYRPWWFEEPVLADLIPLYAEIRQAVRGKVCIAGGEHEYTRWGVKALLDAGAVDVLQTDPTWAGGLTEMIKICALASTYGVPVIPHHGGLASAHLIYSQPLTTCPLQEWLLQHGLVGQHFYTYKIEPVNGVIVPPDQPGLGIVIDESRVEERVELTP